MQTEGSGLLIPATVTHRLFLELALAQDDCYETLRWWVRAAEVSP